MAITTKGKLTNLEATIKSLPTKDEFYLTMDKLLKEISTIRKVLARIIKRTGSCCMTLTN